MNVYLDQRVKVNGTYDSATDLTTFTLPYEVNTNLQCVNAATGADLTINSQTGTTAKVKGNIASAYFGFPFTTLYTLSTDYVNSGFFQVVVTHNTRTDKTYSFNGYIIDNPTSVIDSPVVTSGVFRVSVQAENTQHTVSFRSSSYLPASIVSADVEGFYYRRSQRV